jgi:hypothetical protein
MVDLMKSGISVGVGVVDEVMESWDEKEGRTEPFRKATDIVRLLGALGGYALQIFMPRQARIGEALALSATPLLVKSVAKPIRAAIGGGTEERVFLPRKRQPVGAGAGARPQNPGGGNPSPGRNLAQDITLEDKLIV